MLILCTLPVWSKIPSIIFASCLYKQVLDALDVHPKIVQELLGHSRISLTVDIYSHVLPSLQAEAVNRLGILLPSQV